MGTDKDARSPTEELQSESRNTSYLFGVLHFIDKYQVSAAIVLTRSIGPRREALAPVPFVPKERGGLLVREPEGSERHDVRGLEPVRSSISIDGPPTGILGSCLPIDSIMHRSPSHKGYIEMRTDRGKTRGPENGAEG